MSAGCDDEGGCNEVEADCAGIEAMLTADSDGSSAGRDDEGGCNGVEAGCAGAEAMLDAGKGEDVDLE